MDLEDFDARGWVKLPGLVSDFAIDRLLREFKDNVLPSTEPMHRQPNFSRTSGEAAHPHGVDEMNAVSQHGFLINGLKDPHNWEASNRLFASLILDILSARGIRDSLSNVHPASDWVLHATMFFDRNQATEPHEDIYYIDSNPTGACLGFWLALEDIDERAGRFYFVEGSHRDSTRTSHHPMELENAEHLKLIEDYTSRNRNQLVAPELRKGDALIWHGRTIHGALPVQDERFSRKSLTAHFIDSARVGRNRFRDFTSVEIRRFNDLRYVSAIRPDENTFAPTGSCVRDVQLPGGRYRFVGIDRAGGDRVVLSLEPDRDRSQIESLIGSLSDVLQQR